MHVQERKDVKCAFTAYKIDHSPKIQWIDQRSIRDGTTAQQHTLHAEGAGFNPWAGVGKTHLKLERPGNLVC